ncbi:MAG: 2-oxoacid:ferredoxin oxidoreductase subunit beta, partial [Candidatus Lokiarchaeota archaeon]|nr:2-oxoacid:ferredoxin oxidoreductase subunit beta [Candidatus Lokiarchaeota archaeon]MBD3339150.1 2-oxoacid:ferredoxin oxidoreductase subunit beta [Candidatus Lokiarchaeota archaeon]
IDDLQISQDNLVFVSGIGCSSRLPAYLEAYGIHTTHGRAIAFATGIKVTNPELTVVVFTGDGDIAAIGLNHFLQSIRRNIDITVICINNENYGMTGGQVSPTTPMGYSTATTPYRNIEHSFNLSFLAKAAGAVYAARWTTAHSMQAIKSIKRGLQKKGLAFIEMLSSCPVNKKMFKTPREYLNYFLKETISYNIDYKNDFSSHVFKNLNECFTAHCEGKLLIGEIADLDKPDYHNLYQELKERARDEFWKAREE